MKTINVYTDGACKGNPGPGGWGAVILYGTKKSTLSGGAKYTTNNEMELRAVLSALNHIKECATKPYRVNIYSDSAYVCNAIKQKWINKWHSNGWKTTRKSDKPSQPIKNLELWMDMYDMLHEKDLKINVIKVKGHADNEYNNEADKVACDAAIRHREG